MALYKRCYVISNCLCTHAVMAPFKLGVVKCRGTCKRLGILIIDSVIDASDQHLWVVLINFFHEFIILLQFL